MQLHPFLIDLKCFTFMLLYWFHAMNTRRGYKESFNPFIQTRNTKLVWTLAHVLMCHGKTRMQLYYLIYYFFVFIIYYLLLTNLLMVLLLSVPQKWSDLKWYQMMKPSIDFFFFNLWKLSQTFHISLNNTLVWFINISINMLLWIYMNLMITFLNKC